MFVFDEKKIIFWMEPQKNKMYKFKLNIKWKDKK